MIYGHKNTIHGSKELDVEVDAKGQVVGVWFRCALLPFMQCDVDATRAKEVTLAYQNNPRKEIVAIEFED